MNNYNVAWKKLFEFISKSEKDKALGIYRLLSFNLKDKALALKIKGDIYLAFNDIKEALIYYQKACELYKSYEKIKEFNDVKDCINYINKSSNILNI